MACDSLDDHRQEHVIDVAVGESRPRADLGRDAQRRFGPDRPSQVRRPRCVEILHALQSTGVREEHRKCHSGPSRRGLRKVGVQAILVVQCPAVGQAQDAERRDELGDRCHREEAVGRQWLAMSVAADGQMLDRVPITRHGDDHPRNGRSLQQLADARSHRLQRPLSHPIAPPRAKRN